MEKLDINCLVNKIYRNARRQTNNQKPEEIKVGKILNLQTLGQ